MYDGCNTESKGSLLLHLPGLLLAVGSSDLQLLPLLYVVLQAHEVVLHGHFVLGYLQTLYVPLQLPSAGLVGLVVVVQVILDVLAHTEAH